MRNTLGLPLNAPYACTVMHETVNQPFQSFLLQQSIPLNHELNQGVAPPGFTHLTYCWRAKQVEEKKEKKQNTCEASVYALMCMF